MERQEITQINLGQSLDNLANLDPRGYGVCNILYKAARNHMKEPLTMNAAKKLVEKLKDGSLVYILTGFILPSHNAAEMDGIVSSMLLARALVKAFNAKPVVICPSECLVAVRNMSRVVGLHLMEDIDMVMSTPVSMGVVEFTKDVQQADILAESIIDKGLPDAVISIEAPGANELGVYHNAGGLNATDIEAKTDILFKKLKNRGILNIAIGDLGNEIGMGILKEHLYKYVPFAAKQTCCCSCGGGIVADTETDNIITATVSDWGCCGMVAALAYLKRDITILQSEELQKEAIYAASRSGMIDMTGWIIPAIDGIGIEMNINILRLMKNCVENTFAHEGSCGKWFEQIDELGFFKA